jgi:hypothetical protein
MENLSAAMAKAFALIEGAVKGKTNPAFRSKYADLAAVVDAIKPHLAEHGLWFRQITHPAEHGVCVETVIHHASGESLGCGPLFMPATKQDAQGYGSALTYARRYSLMAAFGVPAEDDDAQAAVASAPKPIARVAPARRADIQQQIDACADRAALNALYKSLTETERGALVDVFTDAAGQEKMTTGVKRVVFTKGVAA